MILVGFDVVLYVFYKKSQLGPKLGPRWRHVAPGTPSKGDVKKDTKKLEPDTPRHTHPNGWGFRQNPFARGTRGTIQDQDTQWRRRRMEDMILVCFTGLI